MFAAVRVRRRGDIAKAFEFPGITKEGNIVEDKFDNGFSYKVIAKDLILYKKTEKAGARLISASPIEMTLEVIVTDCRVLLKCEDFARKKPSLFKRRGEVLLSDLEVDTNRKLVGHFRYEWLVDIMYCDNAADGLSDKGNRLRISYIAKDKSLYVYEIVFDKETEARPIANEILHRACKYRLAMKDTKKPSEIEFLEKYSKMDMDHYKKMDGFTLVSFPYWFKAPNGSGSRPEFYNPTLKEIVKNTNNESEDDNKTEE